MCERFDTEYKVDVGKSSIVVAAIRRAGAALPCFSFILAACLLLTINVNSIAASVLQRTFLDLCQQSALIFEGRVVQVEAREDPSSGLIWTYVTFSIVDTISGPESDGVIELAFLGGSVGDLTLQVADMEIPESGEAGIYFVESLARKQTHPFFGWSQGHFVVKPQPDGQRYIFTRKQQPVYGIEAAPVEAMGMLSQGLAAGVDIAQKSGVESPLDVEEFKTEIRRNLPTPD